MDRKRILRDNRKFAFQRFPYRCFTLNFLYVESKEVIMGHT